MTECQNLKKVRIEMAVEAGPLRHAAKFEVPANLESIGPFPPGLQKLKLLGTIWNYREEKIRQNRGPDCRLILRDPTYRSFSLD